MAQLVRNPPPLQEPQETQVCSLGREDPLEEDMATRSSLGNPMNRGAWWAAVQGVAEGWTRLRELHFLSSNPTSYDPEPRLELATYL